MNGCLTGRILTWSNGSEMNRVWKIKDNGHSEVISKLAEALNVSPIIATLLEQRGITSFEQARDFFRPDLAKLHDPFLMNDMELAVKRLESAFKNGEKIPGVYGDYDVDGTTSVAIMFSFIRKFHREVDYYIPLDRLPGLRSFFKGN